MIYLQLRRYFAACWESFLCFLDEAGEILLGIAGTIALFSGFIGTCAVLNCDTPDCGHSIILPIIALLFGIACFFGIFWINFKRWCDENCPNDE